MRKQQSARAAQVAERERQVVSLRTAGATWDAIARQTGYSTPWGATQAFKRAMKKIPFEAVNEMRKSEGERLNQLQMSQWAQAMNGSFKHAEAVIRIMERRARLFGLDMPEQIKVQVLTKDVMDQAIQDLEAQLAAFDR